MKYPILALIISFISFGNLNAQNDEQAKNILDKVSVFYTQQQSIEADFVLNIVNDDAGIDESQNGKLLVKGDQYKISTEELVRVSDGQSIWTHFLNDQEIQITDFDPEEEEMTPAKLFTIYEEGYLYSYVGRENGMDVIDLSPEDTDNPYFKIRLFIDSGASYIKSGTVYSRNGTQMTYSIQNMDFSEGDLGDENFKYDTSRFGSEVEVVDLRF